MFISPGSWLGWLLYWIVSAVALAITAAIVPGFRLKNFRTAMVASLIIGIVNFCLRWLLIFLTLPLTILTLGLFIFVVDAIILKISSWFIDDFEIANWFSAILGAIILAFMSGLLHWLII